MNLLSSPEFKVGFLVVVVSSLIGFMTFKVSEGPGVLGGSNEHYFVVEDAGGLVKNSIVKMAGIKIGIIKDIELIDGKAKVILELDDDIDVRTSSKVELRSDGILGDRHVELVPGNPGDPVLDDGSQIVNTDASGGLDQVMKEVGNITVSLKELADNLNRATKGEGDDSTAIGRIVLNIEKITKDLSEITDKNTPKIHNIIAQVESITKNIDDYVNAETLARVEKAVRNVEEITDKVNRGEGTLGRLINDEETVEELNAAITNVNEFLGGAQQMETSLDFHSEYISEPSLTKSYLGVKLQPGLDRYYEVQVIDDPRGVKRSTFTEATYEDGEYSTEDKTVTFHNKIKLTALFAKNFYDFTVKGGIIENSGGVAFDYHILRGKMFVSTEFFEFDNLYIRAFLRYNFFKGIYLIGGGDNLLSSGETDVSAFFGAGIFITNDDLKMLASKVSL